MTTEDSNLRVCRFGSLGLPPAPGVNEAQWRRHRRRLGEACARERIIKSQKVDCYSDGTTVVHRREEDWSSQQSYVSCIFLDDHDTVLASDASGKIDLIKLPPYGSSEKPRTLGSRLVSQLEVLPPDDQRSRVKIKSIKGGRAFVVGLPCGNHYIFSCERDFDWSKKQTLSPTLFTQRHTSSFIKGAWTIRGPRRRYYRERESATLSLSHLVQSENLLYHDLHVFSEIDDWNSEKAARNRRSKGNQARWDFRETASGLLSAHVDAEQDCFWLRLLDDRTHNSRPVVCVDRASRDKPPIVEEHITACAFASEFCLATSHVWFGTTSPQQSFETSCDDFEKVGDTNTCVKLWDIRMLSSKRTKPLDTIQLPVFPNDQAFAMNSSTEVNTMTSERGDYVIGREQGNSDYFVTNLATSDNNATLIITSKAWNGFETQHHVLDLGRLEVKRKVFQKHDKDLCSVYGFASIHNYMACLSRKGTNSSILLYDLNESKKSRGTKRSLSRMDNANSLVGAEDVTWSSRIDPVLKDGNGLPTQLSCMALNRSGCAVLGGSVDGDLFVWRGS